MLVAIARDEQLLRKSVLESLQIPRSTARDARDRLFSGGYIAESEDRLSVVDPLFGLWLARDRRHLLDVAGRRTSANITDRSTAEASEVLATLPAQTRAARQTASAQSPGATTPGHPSVPLQPRPTEPIRR